jgi:N,N'-diacetylchitobiose transport system permease protein
VTIETRPVASQRAVRPSGMRRTLSRGAGRPGRRRGKSVANIVGLALAAVFAFPVYWMVNSSFLETADLRGPDPVFLPLDGTFGQFRKVFANPNFVTAITTSAVVTVLTVVCAVLFAFLAALAVTRFRFLGRKGFILTILVIQMIPAEALFISQFRMLDGWNLTNNVLGLTLLYVAAVVPFTVWMLRGFVAGVPRELEEAAMVDGCSRTRAFFAVVFPLLAPGLVAAGVFGFMQAWNEFTLGLVVMNRPESMTLPVWLRTFTGANQVTDWGGVMAASVILAVPVVAFFMLVQHRMASGLVSGAVKG